MYHHYLNCKYYHHYVAFVTNARMCPVDLCFTRLTRSTPQRTLSGTTTSNASNMFQAAPALGGTGSIPKTNAALPDIILFHLQAYGGAAPGDRAAPFSFKAAPPPIDWASPFMVSSKCLFCNVGYRVINLPSQPQGATPTYVLVRVKVNLHRKQKTENQLESAFTASQIVRISSYKGQSFSHLFSLELERRAV